MTLTYQNRADIELIGFKQLFNYKDNLMGKCPFCESDHFRYYPTGYFSCFDCLEFGTAQQIKHKINIFSIYKLSMSGFGCPPKVWRDMSLQSIFDNFEKQQGWHVPNIYEFDNYLAPVTSNIVTEDKSA